MRPRSLLRLGLVAVCVVGFAPGLTGPAIRLDDAFYTSENAAIQSGVDGLAILWSSERAWTAQTLEFFPLRDTVYWIAFQFSGLEPLGFHLASLLFHIATSLLVLELARRCGMSPWAAAAGAYLFAVHPIHVESVTWIAGLKDPMYTCFMVGSLLAWARSREANSARAFVAALLLMVAALLCKSMAFITPLLMLSMDRLVGQPTPWRLAFRRALGPFLIAGLFVAQFVAIGRANDLVTRPHGGSWVGHVVLALWSQVKYLQQAVVPTSFRLVYCFEPASSLLDGRAILALFLLSGLAVAAVVWRGSPQRVLCLCWYFACLLPASNIVPFPAVMADRYLYAASIGSCLLIAQLLESAIPRLRTMAVVAVTGILLLVTALRAATWKDEELLFAEADEDPACMVDPDFTAAQVHLMRFQSSKDPATQLAALERTITSKGWTSERFSQYCEALVPGSTLSLAAGKVQQARAWAVYAARACPHLPDSWNVLMAATVHVNLDAAAVAARRASQLHPSPRMRLLKLLTTLELGPDEKILAQVQPTLEESPQTACAALFAWAAGAPRSLLERLSASLRQCDELSRRQAP